MFSAIPKIYYDDITMHERLISLSFYVSLRFDHRYEVEIPHADSNAFYKSLYQSPPLSIGIVSQHLLFLFWTVIFPG